MGCYPKQKMEVKLMYNMGFYFRDTMKETSFIAGLELEGISVRHLGGGRYSAIGLSEEHREYIERYADRFWAF